MTNKPTTMKLAVIGNGKMGKEVTKVALARNWEICKVIDHESDWSVDNPLSGVDVAVEFTNPEAVVANLIRCFQQGVPVICGTTGWYHRIDEVRAICAENEGTLLFAPNFSKGVNILFALNRYLATIFENHPEYDVSLSEYHHTHKLDAPSGTAIRLAETIIRQISRKNEWVKGIAESDSQLGIVSYRNGEIPGNHVTVWDSPNDSIQIIHQVKNREVFANGALDAAEWIIGRKGVFGLEEMLFSE
jgi:4-hydroxy-tetrahydrodipicolinate reductase